MERNTVRCNALTHGVLSQCTVLPHEDVEAFTELLTEFINEHQPQGITEHHLVEELVGIVWRNRSSFPSLTATAQSNAICG